MVGDELLIAVADRLTRPLRPGDSLARLAGDEFVALCVDLEDPSQAEAIASRVDAELARPFMLGDLRLNITASIGIAFTGRGIEAPEALLHDADLAMYRSTRDRAGTQESIQLRRPQPADYPSRLAGALHGAAGRGEMRLEYQPIVDTRDGRLGAVIQSHPDGSNPVLPAPAIAAGTELTPPSQRAGGSARPMLR